MNFKHGAIIYIDNITIFDVYSIDILKENNTIEFNDINGFTIGLVRYYNEIKEIGTILFNSEDYIDSKNEIIILENGKLKIN